MLFEHSLILELKSMLRMIVEWHHLNMHKRMVECFLNFNFQTFSYDEEFIPFSLDFIRSYFFLFTPLYIIADNTEVAKILE